MTVSERQHAQVARLIEMHRPALRVRCMHGTVQVSSFYFQPKGEGKVRLHAANNCWEGYRPYIDHLLMKFLGEMNSLAVGCSDR